MAAGVHIQEPVLDTLRREGENEELMDQASNIILDKILVEGNIGARHAPIEAPDTLETEFEVKDTVKGNEGSASTIEGEKFLKSPSAEEVYFEENNLAPDGSHGNAEKMATEHETDVGEGKLDAEESNGLEKGLVSTLEVAATREAGHDESIPVHEAGLSDNKEDRESTIPEKEAANLESLNVNPEDTKTCGRVHDTETTSSVEEKSMTTTSQEIPVEKIEQTTFDSNQETPENISTAVPNEETEQNLSIKLDDSRMKTDEILEKEEDEKPESTLVPEGKIKDEESTQNELFETKNDTETVIQKCEEVTEKGVESSPVAASEAEDIKASTSDHDTKTRALENQIPTDNPQEIEVEKSECKPDKETPKEQVEDVSTSASMTSEDDSLTKHEAHLEKESEKPCFTDASMTDASNDETTPVDKAKTEDEEPSKSDLFENKEDTESKILVEEPIIKKHLESLNTTSDDIKACGLVQDTETESSTEEKLPTATPQEIWGNKIEQTSFDTKEETPEDISTNASNEETEQNSIVEVPFITEALTADNVLAITEGKIKDEDQREKDLLENKNDTESELLKQEVTEKPVESLQLADEAEDTKVSASDQDTKISALENQILTENPQEIVADETESKPCDAVDTKKETLDVQDVSTIETNDAFEENSVIEENESEKPLLREELTRDTAGDESTYTRDDKTEGKDQRRAELIANPDSVESMSILKLVESPQVDAEDIKTHVLDQDAETTGLILSSEGNFNDGESAVKYEAKTEDDDPKEDQLCDSEKNLESDVLLEAAQIETPIESLQETLPSTVPQEFLDDKTEEKTVDAIQKDEEILDVHDGSTIESNDDQEEISGIEEDESEKPLLREESTRDAVGNESTYTHKDKAEGKDQRRAELFENPDSVESMSLIEDNTIPKPVESPQVNAEDIKTRVLDQDSETTGLTLASEGNSNDGESAVKYEVQTEDDDQKEDQLCDNEKNPESSVHLKAAQIETPIESLQETLPSTVPQGFLDNKTEERTVDAIQKDKEIVDEQNVTKTVSNEKIGEDSSIQMDESQIQHGESLEKEHEMPSLIGASTKHTNDDELIITDDDTIEHEDLRKVDLLESKKDAELILQKNEAQIETHITPLQVAAGDIIASDSYQGTETPNSQEKRILNENEIVHGQTEVERVDTAHTKETPEALHDASTIVFNDDHGENSVLGEDESQMKNEENLGEEIKKPSLIEASRTYASGDESTNKRDDKSEGEEQMRAESLEDKKDTESTLLKEEETAVQPLQSPHVDVEDIKTYVSDQGTETTGLVEVLEGVANDDEPEIKQTEDEDQKKVESCETKNVPDSALLLEAAQMEKPFESSKEALPTLVPQGFLDEKVEENATTTVSKENIEDDSLLQVDDSQIQCKGYSEEESQITSIIEASTKNKNDDISVQIYEDSDDHEDLKKDEFGDTKITSQEEEAQVEMPEKSSNIAAEDIIASGSCQETETSSQEERTLNEEETVCEQIDVETLDNTDTKTQTSEAQDISTNVDNEETEQNSIVEVPFITESLTADNVLAITEGKIKDEDQREKDLIENKNDTESELLKQEGTEKHVESLQLDDEAEDTKVSASDQDTKISALENQILTENREIVADETESKPCDAVDTKKETLDVQDVSTIETNDAYEENSVIKEDESEKSLLREESTRDAADDEPTYTVDDKTEGKDQRRAELIENPDSAESMSLIEDNTILKLVESPQVDAEDIKTHVLDQDAEITGLILASEGNFNDGESAVKYEAKTEDDDQKEDQLCDSEKNLESDVLLEAAQIETPIESLQETLPSAVPQEFLDDKTEEKTVDAIQKDKEILDEEDISTIVPNYDSGQISVTEENDLQMKNEGTFGKETEKPSVTAASTTDASGDDSANHCEDKVEGEEQTGAELFEDKKDMESKLIKEEVMVRLVESPQVDTEDIKTYVSDEGAETTGMVEASEGDADEESAVKNEVQTEDNHKKEDELSDKEKNPESGELQEAAQTEKPIESLQETLPSTIPRGFLDDNTEEKIVDAIRKDEDIQNVLTTVSTEKIENSVIQMDGSQLQNEECLEKEHEIPAVIEASTKHANIEHEDLRKVELLESEKDTEINLQEDEAQIKTHIMSSPGEDIIASDSYQGRETTDSQEERILNENEIVHKETEVEKLDAADTKKETPEALDVSTIGLNDNNEENLVIAEDDSEMKNEENLGKESEIQSFIEASPINASGGESTKKCEDKIEGEEQTRAEDTERTLLKEAETAAQPLESPQADTGDIKTYVSDRGTETTGLVEVFEEVAHDNQPEVKCTIKTEDKYHKEDELWDNEKIPDSTLHLEVEEMEKPFESFKEALPNLVSRGFLDEKTEEKIIDATKKEEETHEIQNVTNIVSNENIEDDSLLQVDGSQMQGKECPEEESERTPIMEASTKNVNDDDSINVHEDSTELEDLRKDELVETNEDTKIISQKEEAQLETAVKSLPIAAEENIESDSCQETGTMSSQEERILNEEEMVREQIEVETLDTADTKTKTPEAQESVEFKTCDVVATKKGSVEPIKNHKEVSTIVRIDVSEANSATGENEENLGKELYVIEASSMDVSGDESTNKGEDKIEGEEQTGAEMFVDKKDTESTLLKEGELMVKLVESPHVDTENTKTYASDEGRDTTGVVEAFEGDADDEKSAVKYEVKTEGNDQKEDELCDNEKNPESGVLLEAAQIEKPNEFLQDTLPSTVPRELLNDETKEKTMDAIENDKEILDIQNVPKTVSNEKIEGNSLIQADGSKIQHQEYLEKESEIPSVIEASTKHADDDELTSIREDNIENKDLRKVELLESKEDTEFNLQTDEVQMETPVHSLQVAAEDIIASDSYHGTEPTSQVEKILNENEIFCEQTDVERLDTADSDKETPEAQNSATVLPSENINENSQIPEDGSELKHEELFEKENKAPPLSETLTMEANDQVPEIIHQDKIEDEKIENVDKFECDKHEEITLLNEEAPAEKLYEPSKEDLEDIKDIVPGENTTERSLIEVQSLNENQRQIVDNHMEENIVNKDPEEIKEEHLNKDIMFENETHTEIGFMKEEAVKKLQEPTKKDLEEIKAFVSHEGTETTISVEDRDLTDISQESVGDPSEDKIHAKAQEIPNFTPIVSDEQAEKNSSIQPDGSQMKHEELLEKECEMLSTPETSFLYSSSNEPTTIDVENMENKHLNKVFEFEDEKHTKIVKINDQDPEEEHLPEEVKAFVSWEGAETSSIEEQCLTETSQEIIGDQSEEKILDKVGTTQEFTKFVSDENGEDISLMPVDESQIKHEELLEKESETSPLSETSLQNSNFNESSILHQDKTEDGLLNRVDKVESEKHAEISLIKEETPLEKLNESSFRKDLEEIKAFDSSEATETSSTGERNLTAVPQEKDFTTVDASQIKRELLERESETPPLPLLHSSDGKSANVHPGKIEDEVLEKADKFECMESGEATSLNEEASAENLTESSKDLEDKESVTCDGTEITSSKEEQNLTISQEAVDDQVEEKVPNVAGEASDFTTIIPDNTNERNLLVEVDASQIKHGEHLEKESEIPSSLMLNTSTEEPKIVHENKIMEQAEIILSNEEALENPSKEENENIKASVLCEDIETSCTEQESLIANSHEIVADQVKEKINDMAQNAPDLTTSISDENAEENSLIQSDGSQIKHAEPQEKERETPSISMLDTASEESTILQDRIIDDQYLRKVDNFEREKDAEATFLKEPTPAEKVTESSKDDLEDTKVFLSCEDKEITSSIEEPSKKANEQEIMVDQTQENILDSATKAQDFKQTVSHENAENSLIQVDESQVKHDIMIDQTQENVLDTAPNDDQDFKPAISHENAEENALIQVVELPLKHDELEKESEMPSLLIVDTSNKESRIIHEDITEDESLKKIHEFECEKHEDITSTEEETHVTKVNESLKEDLEYIKALVSGEDSETTSFEEKQSLKENPREILSDQQEEKVLDTAPEARNFIKVVSNEKVEKDSMVQEDGSKMVHEEILEKEGETPSLSVLNTTSDDSKVIQENKIENEDTREVDIFDYEKHVDGKILDAAPEASETTLLNTSNEDSTTINDDKIEDEDPEKVDKLECEKHTEVPLTKEEEPVQKLNNPSKEDIVEIKAFVSCLDTETTSSTEDRSLQINPQEVMGDQMEETIIDTTPEPQNFITLVSEENTKEILSLDVYDSQIKHEELSENESEKPSLSILKTSNEESSFIRDSETEEEDVKRDEKVEQLNVFPEEGPENIKVSVPSENLETTSPIEERSLTENSQENLTKDKSFDVVPEALELKTILSDKNIEENSFILEDGSQMKHEEHSEKDSEIPSLTETSILNTGNEESTHFLDDKIEDEDQAKDNKSESEKHAEITEVPVEKESEIPSLTETSIPSTGNEETKLFPDDKNDDEDQTKVNNSESEKHAEFTEVLVEKESEMPSWAETSILSTRNEEPTLFLDDKIEGEDQAKVRKFESEEHAEVTEAPVENPNSSNLENIEAFVSCEDTEPTNSTEEQSLKVNPIENVGGQKVEKVLDKALEALDFAPIVPNDNNDDNPSIQVDGSQIKHEEPLEKESNNVASSLETSLLNTNNEEPETIHKDKIEDEALKNVVEFESKKCSEINKLKEEAQVEESMAYKDIKACVSYQDTEASALQEQILTANPQDILGNRSEDNFIDTIDSKEKITENLTVSNENVVKDSLTQKDESEIKHEGILEKEPYLAKTSALEANKESTTTHKHMIEEESGKIIESTLLNEGSGVDEFVESLQVMSEDIKAPVSCQKTDTTTSNLNADPQEIAGDQTDDKITTAGTREITLEALNLTTLVSNENEVVDSITPQDGLEIEHEETSLLADNKESIIIHEDAIEGEELKKLDTGEQQTENTLLKEEAHEDESKDSLQVASERIKASVSCQDGDPTSSFDEQTLTTTTQIVGDQLEEKVTDTAKTWEETPEVSSSILVFQEDEANRIGVDDISSVMIKDEETLNKCTASNAAENDEICSSDKVQAKEEEMEIISKTAIDEEEMDDTWIELTDDETNKTYIEEKEIDVSSHGKDTSEITQHDGAKDIPKGNENSTAKNEFLEDGYSHGSTESTTPIVNEDFEQIDKDIKAETAITETGAASSALPITGVQCGSVESEDSKAKDTETSLAPEGREYQGQHTKLHESPSPPLPHVQDSELEMAQERGGDDLQSGDDRNDDMKELDEGSVAISNEGNFLEANSNENIETEVTAGEKEASAIQHDPVSEFAVQEIQEQPGKTVEAVPEEKRVKSEEGEINFDDSDESVPEEKGINTEESEIKEHNFNVLKENSRTVALDKVTPVNILQGSTTDAALRTTDEETPEQHGLDEASLKENGGGRASATDKLTVLRADQIDNADSSLGSNKIEVLQHGNSSESSNTEGEKQKASETENGEKRGNEETAKLMETSESTEMDKPSLSGLRQDPMKEVSKVVDRSIDKKEPTTKEEELQAEKSSEVEHVEEKTDEEKDGEKESCVHQISDLSSDTPVIVDAVDKDVKVVHKKSQGILSGVGSKVKHSISKVKKAITGKSSHPKSASPKYSQKI